MVLIGALAAITTVLIANSIKRQEEYEARMRIEEKKRLEISSTNNFIDLLNKEIDKESCYNEFKKEIEEFCTLKFKEIPFDNIITIVNQMIKSQNLISQLKSIIEKEETTLSNEVKHFNVLVIGKTGTGKSTLINEVLELEGEDAANTATGSVVTLETKSYESIKHPSLRLWDTRGIELAEYTVEDTYNLLSSFIKNKFDNKNPDHFIHCLWYCIRANRLENSETILLKKLLESNSFDSKQIPLILVHTVSDIESDFNEMKSFLQKNFNDFQDISIVRTLAKKRGPYEKFGLKGLIMTSLSKLEKAVESSLYTYLKGHLYDHYIAKFQKLSEKMNKEHTIDYSEFSKYTNWNMENFKDDLPLMMVNNMKNSFDNSNLHINFRENYYKDMFKEELTKIGERLQNKLTQLIDDLKERCSENFNRKIAELKKSVNRNGYLREESILQSIKDAKETTLGRLTRKINNYSGIILSTLIMGQFTDIYKNQIKDNLNDIMTTLTPLIEQKVNEKIGDSFKDSIESIRQQSGY